MCRTDGNISDKYETKCLPHDSHVFVHISTFRGICKKRGCREVAGKRKEAPESMTE